MRLKKMIMLGAVLSSLPLVANADLYITNNTPYPSAVSILGKCSGPAVVTPAGAQKKPYPQALVKLLCNEASSCTAEIYANKNGDCSSNDLGSATINTTSDIITGENIKAGHEVDGVGTNLAVLVK